MSPGSPSWKMTSSRVKRRRRADASTARWSSAERLCSTRCSITASWQPGGGGHGAAAMRSTRARRRACTSSAIEEHPGTVAGQDRGEAVPSARRPSESVWSGHEYQQASRKAVRSCALVAPRQRVAGEQPAVWSTRKTTEPRVCPGVGHGEHARRRSRRRRPSTRRWRRAPPGGRRRGSTPGRRSARPTAAASATSSRWVSSTWAMPPAVVDRSPTSASVKRGESTMRFPSGRCDEPGRRAEGVLRAVAEVEDAGAVLDLARDRAGSGRACGASVPMEDGRAGLRGQPGAVLGRRGRPAGRRRPTGSPVVAEQLRRESRQVPQSMQRVSTNQAPSTLLGCRSANRPSRVPVRRNWRDQRRPLGNRPRAGRLTSSRRS